jgi:hypothetical protein
LLVLIFTTAGLTLRMAFTMALSLEMRSSAQTDCAESIKGRKRARAAMKRNLDEGISNGFKVIDSS